MTVDLKTNKPKYSGGESSARLTLQVTDRETGEYIQADSIKGGIILTICLCYTFQYLPTSFALRILKPFLAKYHDLLLGRKNIKINGMVCSVTLKTKPNQPDRLHIDWDGKMILLNVWKKQPYFHVEKGRQYIFSNISCRVNKYINQLEFHYDPEYYGSHYEEWPGQTHQKTSQSSQSTPLAEMLEKFGCSPSAAIEEVKAKKRYWNQVLHPDFNVGKPEKLRKQMEEELKQKNQLYDRIMQLMDK
ncbi:MAG: hypothetical protein WBA22_12640 [Candidatus Methanofastidiosia archaeon]